MKRIIIATLCVSVIVLTYACNKDNQGPVDFNQGVQEASDNLAKAGDWQVSAQAHTRIKWHRPIETRPRDGATCACQYCFGICAETDLTINVNNGMPPLDSIGSGLESEPVMTLFDFDSYNDKLTLYVMEDIRWDKSTIQVDTEPIFNSSASGNTWRVKLTKGSYTFDQTHNLVTDGVDTLQAYGRFTIPVIEL